MAKVQAAPLNFLIVTDPGPDPDDVKVIISGVSLQLKGAIRVDGIVCNGGGQARERAKLAKVAVRLAGIPDIRVGVGTPGVERKPQPHEYDIEGYNDVSDDDLEDGHTLFMDVLQRAEPNNLIVQCQAGLTDVMKVMKKSPELFIEKVYRVSIMGGMQRRESVSQLAEEDRWMVYEADTAQNNVYDMDAARYVYDFCLAKGVQMHIVARDAVPMLPMVLATSFAKKFDSDLLRYLGECQSRGLVQLWGKVCSGTELPARCTKEWFFVTFCGVDKEQYCTEYSDLGADCKITEYLNGSVKPYDVVSFMSNLPSVAGAFDWENAEVLMRDTRHYFFLKRSQAIETDAVEQFLSTVFQDVGRASKKGGSRWNRRYNRRATVDSGATPVSGCCAIS